MSASTAPDIHLAFDVGHSSIGWAVLRSGPGGSPDRSHPSILGTGVVTFGADDCLAVKRRQFRQTRRHVRATRQRIAHIARLLVQLGVLSEQELASRHRQAGGDSFAWRLAADVLVAARTGSPLPAIGWPELWDILRWYAHNRGYFAPPWANRSGERGPGDGDADDTEKVENAETKMGELQTGTMAETIAAYAVWYEREVAKWHQKQRAQKPPHFKGLSMAFPRKSVVWPEVRELLEALRGRLPLLDDALIRTLLGNDVDPLQDPRAWQTIPCPSIKLPKRYHGGLLFGQSIPRFDNRIIGTCPILFGRLHARYLSEGLDAEEARARAEKESKLPSKASPEFLRFRWAMQLANVFGSAAHEPTTRPLTAGERTQVTEQAEQRGKLTAGEFKKVVLAATGWSRSNLDNLLMHPDAKESLVLDPVQVANSESPLNDALSSLPDRYSKRLRGKLRDGKTLAGAEVRSWLENEDLARFDSAVATALDKNNSRLSKGKPPATAEGLLRQPLAAPFPAGRAPYSRSILREAYDEVMDGRDPRAEKSATQPRGCLCITRDLQEAQLHRAVDAQTNNHLIRHRLMILARLQRDLIQSPEFADGNPRRIATVTIEVNRDIRDLSGKNRKEQEQDLNIRLKDFKHVAAKVEEACKERSTPVAVTAGLIRKARIAEDLGWVCPYTQKPYEIAQLLSGEMDKDHIIPHAHRQSDSLDSLAMTWKEVNTWKGKRTALQFIRDEGGRTVPGRPELTIMTETQFKNHVEGLDTKKGHADDKSRKSRRKKRLLTERHEEKEFTPRDLTVTSHLVRLGAQVLKRAFPDEYRPHVVSLPGSVTGEVRKAWRLIGCLGAANPGIFEPNSTTPKRKDDIRGITHLHHALDACVLGLASLYFPRNGSVWSAMTKAGAEREADDERRLWLAMTRRNPSEQEAQLLRATGLYKRDAAGRLHLDPLPNSIEHELRIRLAEKRVVQHIPADMSGVRVEENTRGVVEHKDGRVELRQRTPRHPQTGLQTVKPSFEAEGKLLGLRPLQSHGKLAIQTGVRVITDNFGVAILDHAADGEERFVVIPWHRVWHRVQELRPRNNGRQPRLVRNGMLIRLSGLAGKMASKNGVWRVFSVKQSLKLDLGSADRVVMADSGTGVWREVSLASLGPERITILDHGYAGSPA